MAQIATRTCLELSSLKSGAALVSDLASLPIWAGRGRKAPDVTSGKFDRAPIDPHTGGFASTLSAKTWGTRAQAEKIAAKYPASHQPGVGLLLGPSGIPNGWHLAGIDVDGCFASDGEDIEEWAEDVVHRFDTYTEKSPSGGGLRIFMFVSNEDAEILKARGLLIAHGRTFSMGNHTEIAFFVSGKYMSVTDAVFADFMRRYETLKCANLADLVWLLEEFGPSLGETSNSEAQSARDESGSGYAFRFALSGFQDGLDEDALRALFDEDETEAGEWWRRTDERQCARCLRNAKRRVDDELGKLLELFPDYADDGELEAETALAAAMNARYATTLIGGRFVVIDSKLKVPTFLSYDAFSKLYGHRSVGKERLGAWWLRNPTRRSYPVSDVSAFGTV